VFGFVRVFNLIRFLWVWPDSYAFQAIISVGTGHGYIYWTKLKIIMIGKILIEKKTDIIFSSGSWNFFWRKGS
jgi:hypothetical protein